MRHCDNNPNQTRLVEIINLYLIRMSIPKKIIVLTILLFAVNYYAQKSLSQLNKEATKQFEIGKYADALNTRMEILKIAEKSKNCHDIAFAYWNVGRMQYFIKDRIAALKTNYIAKRYIDSCGIDTIKSIIYNNIGVMYLTFAIHDSALHYFNKTIDVLKNTNRYAEKARAYSLIGELYLFIKGKPNYVESKNNLDLALINSDLSKDYQIQFYVYLRYSEYYTMINNFPLAKKYAQQAYDLVYSNNGRVEDKIYVTRILAQQMALPKNSRVNELYDQFVILRDSVFKTETANKIADYKVLYETEKKETQNKLLQQEISLKQSKIDARNKTIIGLLIGVALIVLLIVWRLNVIKLKKKLIEIENEKKLQHDRERISRDLHDNVGGQLSYVMFSLEGNEELTQEKRMDKNHQLANALRDVTGNLRETIWALNKEELCLQDIADKLKLYARNMFAYSSTKLKFDESIKDDKPLNPVFALTVFRICQEIINNVFKHAQATELMIKIKKEENIQITIADNGIGFISNASDDDSFGLNNIQTRAKEINAKLTITSEINTGTSVTLIV